MSKKLLKEAAKMFHAGTQADFASCVHLMPSVIGDAETVRGADMLRLMQAIAALGARQPAAALAACKEIVELKSTRVNRVAAAACLALGDHAGAEPHLRILVGAGVTEAVQPLRCLFGHRGLASLSAGNHAKAVEWFRLAEIQKIEDQATAYACWIGFLQTTLAMGDYATTPVVFTLFPAWQSDSTANLLAARAAIARVDDDAADAHLRAVGQTPEARSLWWALCQKLYSAQRHRDVIRRFASVVRAPELDEIGRAMVIMVAFSYYAENQAAKGAEYLEYLITKHPDDATCRYYAAYFASLTGDRKKAVGHLRHLKEARQLSTLIYWSSKLADGEFDAVRDAVTPELVNTAPPGPVREALRLIGALGSTLVRQSTRALALFANADHEAVPPKLRHIASAVHGYVALAAGEYATAAAKLPEGPLASLARLEYARSLADAGRLDEALAAVRRVVPPDELIPATRKTLETIRLLQASALVRTGSPQAKQFLTDLRSEQPDAIDVISALEDYLAIRPTLLSISSSDPTQVAKVLSKLAEHPPAIRPIRESMQARRRDLSYLAAVCWFRAIERGGDASAYVGSAQEALERSLATASDFAPSAALLGMWLQYRGDSTRALALLDVAQRQGISSPAIQTALAIEFVRSQRLLEAKRLYFGQVGMNRAAPQRELSRLLSWETINPLAPSHRPPPRPDAEGEPDLFGDTDLLSRIAVLVHHLESRARARPDGAQLKSAARELKLLATSGAISRVIEFEKQAIALMAGRPS